MTSLLLLFCIFCFWNLYVVFSTKVNPCKSDDGSLFQMEEDKAWAGECDVQPCLLKRNTTVVMKFIFTPDEDVQKLTNSAIAIQGVAKIPFPGIDKKSACNNIFMPDEVTQVDCPLSAGQQYVYKWPIFVKPAYPKVSAIIHYELKGKGKSYACMEFQGKIV